MLKPYIRLKETIAFFQSKKDDSGLKLLQEAMAKAVDYVSIVSGMEIQAMVQKSRLETGAYRELFTRLDRQRSFSHNALISSCKAANRYYREKYPDDISVGGIFDLPKEKLENLTRQAIGDWAMDITRALFDGRQR